MKLKATYAAEELDQLPDQYRDLYEERDGSYVLAGIDGVKTQLDVQKVHEALRREREISSSYKKQLAAFGGRDVNEILADLDQIEAYKAAAESKSVDENVIETRLRAKTAPLQRERDKLAAEYAVSWA